VFGGKEMTKTGYAVMTSCVDLSDLVIWYILTVGMFNEVRAVWISSSGMFGGSPLSTSRIGVVSGRG
jgi:hypothetical protein